MSQASLGKLSFRASRLMPNHFVGVLEKLQLLSRDVAEEKVVSGTAAGGFQRWVGLSYEDITSQVKDDLTNRLSDVKATVDKRKLQALIRSFDARTTAINCCKVWGVLKNFGFLKRSNWTLKVKPAIRRQLLLRFRQD